MSSDGNTGKGITENIQKLWHVWDLRVCILFSLCLQTFLILFASSRKRNARKMTMVFIWSAYLLADWVAAFALGLINTSNDDSSGKSQELLAFWAPFLLVHLGGPDTITAFALEDNELWLRHLLGLVFQLIISGYIYFQTLPDSELWLPTLLIFIAGILKYAERTRALYLASMNKFKHSMLSEPDAGPNYAKLMAEYTSMTTADLPAKIIKVSEPEIQTSSNARHLEIELNHREKVRHAYEFFKIFKGLIVDLIFSFHDRHKSRDFFLQRVPEDAFKVIEIELSFIYEVLYTKVTVVRSLCGYIIRSICFFSTIGALLLFLSYNKQGLRKFDIITTYLLLGGALTLDFLALLMIIFSDFTVAAEKEFCVSSCILPILTKVPFLNTSRWSESVSQYNVIEFCLCKRSKPVDYFLHLFGLKEFVDKSRFKTFKPVTLELKKFIFKDLKGKTEIATDAKTVKEICSARGEWILERGIYYGLLAWSVQVDFDESVLLWHIATEIAYMTIDSVDSSHRQISKLLSDYIVSLLVTKTSMMSAVAGIGPIRYRDTCAEAKKFFGTLDQEVKNEMACKMLISVNTEIPPVDVKGDRSKSVLFYAVRLAKDLETIPEERRWKLMSEVWLELLCYAASTCRANNHARQLNKGGELLTFIWLLMTHLGLGQQFRIESGDARTKLVVNK